MQELQDTIKEIGIGQIATVVGRYYAMDRDKRWERVEIALKGLVLGEGDQTDDPVQAVKDVYARGGEKDKDEFLKPIIVGGQEGRIQGKSLCLLIFNIRKRITYQCVQMAITFSSSTTDLIA
jgi:2,3-bisphosphoglycerate-independent phosphoglycerate mutase